MANDNRDVVETLKAELNFLQRGGYRQSLRAPWRPQFIFEDSPTCLNYGCKQRFVPCTECALMQFVPPDCRHEKVPCRHIPLNSEGYTIDTYYRIGTHEELEAAVSYWLLETIRRLEQRHKYPQQEPQVAKPLSKPLGAGQ